MRRRIAEAAAAVAMGTIGALAACGDDSHAPSPSGASAGEASGGSGGEAAGPTAGSDGGGGSPASTGGEGNPGGSPSEGGAPSADAGAATGGAGEGATPTGGAGGSGDVGPPDLIVKTGGPWPDSFTGSCSSTSKAIPCPQLDEPLFGQDGNYRINVPSYASSGNNTITDSITGLMWQLRPEAASKTQASAVGYCDTLSLAGHDDWRLPTRLEYVTLLDEGRPNGFAVPPVIPADSTGTQWTTSATGRAADNFFAVHDERGSINVATAASAYTARCVRGPALTGTLTVGGDTVIDSMTNLEWQRTALEDEDRDWQAALAYCESLTHASKSDWRLPSIKELLTIIDEAAIEPPVVDAASFGDSSAARYWSSTPAPSFSSERFAFALDTGFGSTSDVKMTEFAAARCVRTPE